MSKDDQVQFARLEAALTSFNNEEHPLPGISNPSHRVTLVKQLVESVHRVKYPIVLRSRQLSERRRDPEDGMFDPLKAAILYSREGEIDDACWLVFLFVHFGRHRKGGYLYPRSVFGRLGEGGLWDWQSTSSDPAGFRQWLHSNEERLKALPTAFGNHRKYESLDAYSDNGTGATVATYVEWVSPRSHQEIFDEALAHAGGNPKNAFDRLFQSMRSIRRFGRTAKFDYLSMVGKLGFVSIEPGSAYLSSATGPVAGAKLLFGGSPNAKLAVRQLDDLLVQLDAYLGVGMQAVEDAVCNWQKSPGLFKTFRG